MNTVIVKLSQVKVNGDNPRTITNDKLNKLINSILVFPKMLGIRPVVVDDKMVALGGNMRLNALKLIAKMSPEELGTRLATIADYLKKSAGERENIARHWEAWLQKPTVEIIKANELTEDERKQFIIKDNVAFGTWDYDMLANKFDDKLLGDWGMDVWNVQPATFDSGVSNSGGGEGVVPSVPASSEDDGVVAAEVEEDDFDEEHEPIVCRCKRGDIWQLGQHRVMCGDSSNAEDVAALMGGGLADMVFTDPPYGVSIGDKNKALNSVQPSGRCCENIKNDTLGVEELYPILTAAMTNARLNCKSDASYYVTSQQGGELGLMMMMMMKDAGLPVRHMLVWVKNCATFSLGRLDYDYQHEPIFYTWTSKHHNYRKGENRTTIWKYDKPRKCDLHPTMKPVALVANAMMDATLEGDIVLDVFGGSGTTLIAAEQLNRKARLMELDEHYCDVIITRWEKLTGQKASKLE